jgi:catechol 2,3-dioxygenase-like lactoylglutathione lyase family enzyme
MHKGYGVHHIAVGVKDLANMRSFYRDVLGFTNIFVDFPEAAYPALGEITRSANPVYAAVLFSQPAGGIILELTQMINPTPRPIRKDFRYGDIGLGKMTIRVSNLEGLYGDLAGEVNFCSKPKSISVPNFGNYRFVYCRDPEGNLIEFASWGDVERKEKFGGLSWVGISVTDLVRSREFYQRYLGFDRVFMETREGFSGLVDEVSGAKDTEVRSCVLACSGAEGMVELFEVSHPRGRSIPFAVRWGDYGYLQVCLNGKQGVDIFEIAAYFEREGMEFVCGPQLMGDEREGAFFYMKDPDGIPVEFLNFLK